MKQTRALPWALTLLDDGLRLYRRNFMRFLLVGAIILVPLSLLGLLLSALVETQLGEDWTGLGALLLGLIQYPLMLYACLALSRVAAGSLDGRQVGIGQALRLGPRRALGMGCYGVLLAAIFGTFSGMAIVFVACPMLYAMIFGAGVIGSVGGSGALGALGSVVGVIFSLVFLSTLLLTSAMFASLAYGVQAFALEQRPVGQTISRSLDLLLFRLGRNLLIFVGAGAIIGTLLVAYAGAILAGGAGLLQVLEIELSPVALQSLQSAVGTFSWMLLLPPLPIWMAMLHRSLATERDAPDLVAAVERWRNVKRKT